MLKPSVTHVGGEEARAVLTTCRDKRQTTRKASRALWLLRLGCGSTSS
jgi:hypothetical protein